MWLIWWGLGAAWAGPKVLTTGDADAARALVARATALDPASLDVVTLGDLVVRTDPLAAGGILRRCTDAPASIEAFHKGLSAAEAALEEGDQEFALGPALAAEKAALCATESPPIAELARTEFAIGVARAQAGDVDAARAAWALASRLDGNADWASKVPAAYADTMKIALENAKKHDATWAISVPGGVWLDGTEVGETVVTLGTGLHWIEADAVRALLDVRDSGHLLIPQRFAKIQLQDGTSGERGKSIMRLLDAASGNPDGDVYYLVDESGHGFQTTATGWVPLVAERDRQGGASTAGAALATTGSGLAAGGALLAILAYRAGNQAIDAAGAPGVTSAVWTEQQATYNRGATQLWIGEAAAATGLALIGAGSALLLTDAPLTPWWTPQGGGVMLHFGSR